MKMRSIFAIMIAFVMFATSVFAGELPADESGIAESSAETYIREYIDSTSWDDTEAIPTSNVLGEPEHNESDSESTAEQVPTIESLPIVEEEACVGADTIWAGPRSPFADVQDVTDPFYDGIIFMGNNGFSIGYADKGGTRTFRSNRNCTRSEAIALLWNLKGQPEPYSTDSSPFRDVPMSHPHYKAILWAAQNEIAKGYSDGTFGLNRICTRGDAMMFLWKASGRPAGNGKVEFSDMKNSPYRRMVDWGTATGIVKGFPDGTFGAYKNCTRGQMATFLFRYYMNDFYDIQIKDGEISSIACPVHENGGMNYVTVLSANKTFIDLPTVPQKALFIGNSLIMGLGGQNGGKFGMSAEDSKHDYYYLVTQAISQQNNKASFKRIYATTFEKCVDATSAKRWYQEQRSYFPADLDLVMIQLADNAKTASQQTAFKKNYGMLLKQIKADCPKARIICVASWYPRPALVASIIDACKANGCEFINISDMGSLKEYVPSSDYHITYNDGTAAVMTEAMKTHPNSKAFEVIAQRMLKMLKM